MIEILITIIWLETLGRGVSAWTDQFYFFLNKNCISLGRRAGQDDHRSAAAAVCVQGPAGAGRRRCGRFQRARGPRRLRCGPETIAPVEFRSRCQNFGGPVPDRALDDTGRGRPKSSATVSLGQAFSSLSFFFRGHQLVGQNSGPKAPGLGFFLTQELLEGECQLPQQK